MIEAMKQALEALKRIEHPDQSDVIEVLRQAIAEAEKQEPVAWGNFKEDGTLVGLSQHPEDQTNWQGRKPLYSHPQPKREWVGLTDEEIDQGHKESWVTKQAWESAVWWAEAKLKEKNHG